eukprot:1158823-Pelagomonas_calceolata.AAC.3
MRETWRGLRARWFLQRLSCPVFVCCVMQCVVGGGCPGQRAWWNVCTRLVMYRSKQYINGCIERMSSGARGKKIAALSQAKPQNRESPACREQQPTKLTLLCELGTGWCNEKRALCLDRRGAQRALCLGVVQGGEGIQP